MVCPERKSVEPIALLVGHGDVSGLQKFVGAAPWAYDDVMTEAQALFADELAPSAAGSPVGTVGVRGYPVSFPWDSRCSHRSDQEPTGPTDPDTPGTMDLTDAFALFFGPFFPDSLLQALTKPLGSLGNLCGHLGFVRACK
jgi:hypothetical protein